MKILEQIGLTRDVVLSEIGLGEADLMSPKVRIALRDVTRTFEFASKALNDPNIGLRVGHKFRIYTFAETGSILAFSSTLREAVEINAQYNALVETVGKSQFVRRDDGDYMTWDDAGIDANTHRHITDMVMSGYVITAQWLSWSHLKGVNSLYFKHDAPHRFADYEDLLQCSVFFGCEENAMKLDMGIADVELPSSNPEKLALVRKRLDVVLASFTRQRTLKDQVDYHIAKGISEQSLSEDNIAKAIGISARNLRRYLSKEGTTYRTLVTHVRQELCMAHLRSGRSLTDIAQLLGYSDQSAFIRAFKKWYGVSPSKYTPDTLNLGF